MEQIVTLARSVFEASARSKAAEQRLSATLLACFKFGDIAKIAGKIGVYKNYIYDVRLGIRGLSDPFLDKLARANLAPEITRLSEELISARGTCKALQRTLDLEASHYIASVRANRERIMDAALAPPAPEVKQAILHPSSQPKPNDYSIADGVVTVHIRHRNRPDCYMLINADDWERVRQYGTVLSHKTRLGDEYAYIRPMRGIGGSQQSDLQISRLVLGVTGTVVVDHWNHNTLDNRRENLFAKTRAGNALNRRLPSSNTSGFRCVRLQAKSGRYVAVIRRHNKKIWLGSFATAEEAGGAVASYLKDHDYSASSMP